MDSFPDRTVFDTFSGYSADDNRTTRRQTQLAVSLDLESNRQTPGRDITLIVKLRTGQLVD